MDWISIKQIPGGDVRQSFMVEGVAFKKTFSYAGFEQMTKKFDNPKILLLNVELELKSEKENAEVPQRVCACLDRVANQLTCLFEKDVYLAKLSRISSYK